MMIRALALVALLTLPATACDNTMDAVAAQYAVLGHPVTMLNGPDLPDMLAEVSASTGETYRDVTRAFIAEGSKGLLLGLEIGGCLLPPILLMLKPTGFSA